MTPWHCTACGSEHKATYALYCRACYQRHHRRHCPPRKCRNCKQVTTRPLTRKLCNACYKYWQRHGCNRPRWRETENCTNCARPLPERRLLGMCYACYHYQYLYGVPRPERLWRKKIGLYGWCECGQPANEQITVQVHPAPVALAMCSACAQDERDWQRQRGIGGPTPHALRRSAP